MSDESKDLVPVDPSSETLFEAAAYMASVVPWIGGPISNVLTGISVDRKIGRVCEVLYGLAQELKDFRSEASEEYVKTEYFQELSAQTLRRVQDELNEEKRRIYRDFLIDAIKAPVELYDEQLRFLRTLEEMQPAHIKILKAIDQKPEDEAGGKDTSISRLQDEALEQRLPSMGRERIEDLVNQLNDLRVTNFTSFKTRKANHGDPDLRYAITPYGRRFMKFITK